MHLKSVLITGAASGQGRATAVLLAQAGYRIAAVDVDENGLAALAEELADADITPYVADITNFAEVEQVVDQVTANGGGLDALLACAGISDSAPLASGEPSRWERVIRVNLLGVEHCLRACLPVFVGQQRGTVVVWGSVAAMNTFPGEATYSATKAAITQLTNCLRHEVAEHGVKIGVLHPGMTDTPMMTASPTALEALAELQLTPLEPENIARCAKFMLEQPEGCAISEMVIRPTRQVF